MGLGDNIADCLRTFVSLLSCENRTLEGMADNRRWDGNDLEATVVGTEPLNGSSKHWLRRKSHRDNHESEKPQKTKNRKPLNTNPDNKKTSESSRNKNDNFHRPKAKKSVEIREDRPPQKVVSNNMGRCPGTSGKKNQNNAKETRECSVAHQSNVSRRPSQKQPGSNEEYKNKSQAEAVDLLDQWASKLTHVNEKNPPLHKARKPGNDNVVKYGLTVGSHRIPQEYPSLNQVHGNIEHCPRTSSQNSFDHRLPEARKPRSISQTVQIMNVDEKRCSWQNQANTNNTEHCSTSSRQTPKQERRTSLNQAHSSAEHSPRISSKNNLDPSMIEADANRTVSRRISQKIKVDEKRCSSQNQTNINTEHYPTGSRRTSKLISAKQDNRTSLNQAHTITEQSEHCPRISKNNLDYCMAENVDNNTVPRQTAHLVNVRVKHCSTQTEISSNIEMMPQARDNDNLPRQVTQDASNGSYLFQEPINENIQANDNLGCHLPGAGTNALYPTPLELTNTYPPRYWIHDNDKHSQQTVNSYIYRTSESLKANKVDERCSLKLNNAASGHSCPSTYLYPNLNDLHDYSMSHNYPDTLVEYGVGKGDKVGITHSQITNNNEENPWRSLINDIEDHGSSLGNNKQIAIHGNDHVKRGYSSNLHNTTIKYSPDMQGLVRHPSQKRRKVNEDRLEDPPKKRKHVEIEYYTTDEPGLLTDDYQNVINQFTRIKIDDVIEQKIKLLIEIVDSHRPGLTKYEIIYLRKIYDVLVKCKAFERRIDSLVDKVSEAQFNSLDENLVRNIEKLDRIDPNDSEILADHRKNIIKYIYKLIDKLEEKEKLRILNEILE